MPADSGDRTVDRLWPDARANISLDAAFAARHAARDGRPWVAINMVTSVDGRAQLAGTAEGIGGRVDRRMMQAYRFAFDCVASGAGTLRADDFYSHLPADLADARRATGRAPQPLALVIGGRRPLPTDRRWFTYADQDRVAAVGASSPHAEEAARLPGLETWVAPTPEPRPDWLMERLARRGVTSLLLEGGPTINSVFLAAGVIDEVLWTIGPRILANDGLPMIAPLPAAALPGPVEARLASVHRHGDELYLSYRLGSIGP